MIDAATRDPSGQLTHLGLLRFSGADAAAFLQGQVSNDTTRLAAGRAVLCALSSAQGRVLAVMTLLPHSSGTLAILPRDLVAATAAHLRRYVLRSKVRIEEFPAGLAVGGVGGTERLRAAGLDEALPVGAYAETGGVGFARLNDPQPRFWTVGAPTSLAGPGPGSDVDAGAAWRLADIRAGLPQVHAVNSGEFVAQMLNLDLVDGISFAKGCYTGQEIIARTQHLGRIKRRMFRVALVADAPGPPDIGATLLLADGRSGRIAEIAPAGDGYEALVVLPIEAGADAGTEAGGAAAGAARLMTLPYALG